MGWIVEVHRDKHEERCHNHNPTGDDIRFILYAVSTVGIFFFRSMQSCAKVRLEMRIKKPLAQVSMSENKTESKAVEESVPSGPTIVSTDTDADHVKPIADGKPKKKILQDDSDKDDEKEEKEEEKDDDEDEDDEDEDEEDEDDEEDESEDETYKKKKRAQAKRALTMKAKYIDNEAGEGSDDEESEDDRPLKRRKVKFNKDLASRAGVKPTRLAENIAEEEKEI